MKQNKKLIKLVTGGDELSKLPAPRRHPLRACKAQSMLVGLLLMNLADMVDEKFGKPTSNVVPLRPNQPEPPSAA